jgi:CRISPR-associated endonuclease/helicase Cas3
LEAGKTAYHFDHLDGEWRSLGKKDAATVVPGQMFWIPADQGGYFRDTGWSPGAGALPAGLLLPVPDAPPRSRWRRPEGAYDSDEWSVCGWRTVAQHTDEVVRQLASLLVPEHDLPLTEALRQALTVAARWHDWGKMHPVFQSGIADEIDHPEDRTSMPEDQRRKVPRPTSFALCDAVAKAPDEFWQRYSRVTRPHTPEGDQEQRRTVRRFRHELASVLGVITLRSEGRLPPDWKVLTAQQQVVALYVIVAHHGKVRMSVRTMPDEAPAPPEPGRLFAAGLWDGDTLPAADLGLSEAVEPVVLRLAPMRLGSPDSWSASVLRLRDSPELGPLRLAYLEAVLRAADCRASAEADQERRVGNA